MSSSPISAELKLLRHVRGLRLLVVLLLCLSAIAAINGVLRQAEARVALDDLLVAEAQLRSNLRAGLSRSQDAGIPVAARPGALGFSVLSEYVVMPSPPAAPLAAGASELLPDHYRFDAHAAYLQKRAGELGNPLRLAVGTFDLAFVLVFVVPIIVIALSYDVISREKELGVMALACAQGTSPQHYVARKLIARGLAIVVAIATAELLAFACLGWLSDWPAAITMLAWVGLTLAYALFWFALAAVVNGWDRGSAANGVVLANAWLLFVVIIPSAVALAATSLFPAPSRVNLTTELREAAAEAEERGADAREAYFFDHPGLSGGDAEQEAYFRAVSTSEAEIEESIGPLLEQFSIQADRQTALVNRLRFVSPAIAFNKALARLAGSDREYHDQFRNAAFEHHGRWRTFFVSALDEQRLLDDADWEHMPEFAWKPPTAADRAAATLPTFLVLALLTLLLFAIASVRYRRFTAIHR